MAIPLTYLFEFGLIKDQAIPQVLNEFAANGAKNLVLSDTLIARIFQEYSFADTIKNEMNNAGLKFVDSHAVFGPRMDLCTPLPHNRRISIHRLNMTLEIIAYLGVDTITVHVGNNVRFEEKYRSLEQNIERIEESLSQILPTAEKLGITVCIENIWFPTNTPEVLLGIKEHFPTDALGFCFDAGHANLCANGYIHESKGAHGQVWQEFYGKDPVWDNRIGEKMLPYIVNCHLHDNDGDTDQHKLPGHGNVDWKYTADLLRKAPRLKSIQSEVILSRDPVSIRILCETFRKMFPECE